MKPIRGKFNLFNKLWSYHNNILKRKFDWGWEFAMQNMISISWNTLSREMHDTH